MSIRYWIGGLLRSAGWTAKPTWKEPQSTLNLVELSARLLQAEVENPVIVQVGAFDGQANDPLVKLLSSDRIGAAYLIEPQPQPAAGLRTRYAENSRIQVIEAALADRDGRVTLYSPSKTDQRASLDPAHIHRFGVSSAIQTEVDGITAATFLKKYGVAQIHLLQIDCEGQDFKIMKMFLQEQSPLIINFENFHLPETVRQESRQFLRDRGYHFIENGYDTFCVRADWLTVSHG